MSHVWIISSSDSDSDLPSYSNLLSQKKLISNLSDDENDTDGFLTISQRLCKNQTIENNLSDGLGSSSKFQMETAQNAECKVLVQNRKKETSSTLKNTKTSSTKIGETSEINKCLKTVNIFKLEECLANLTCFISNPVLGIFKDENLVEILQTASSASYMVFTSEHAIVKWKLSNAVTDHPSWDQEKYNNCNQLVYVVNANDFKRINVNTQPIVTHEMLSLFLSSVDKNNSKILVVCVGLIKYKQTLRRNMQKDYKKVLQTGIKQTSKATHAVSEQDIENFFLDIQLSHSVGMIPVESKSEFALLLSQISKAIAETPSKLKQRQNMYYVNEKNSVKIDPLSGEGARAAWKQILEQLFNVSSDISSAIILHYPTLNSLLKTYHTLSIEKSSLLLAEIQIRRGFGTLQQSRRLGPELSKKIYKFFTSEDGNEVV